MLGDFIKSEKQNTPTQSWSKFNWFLIQYNGHCWLLEDRVSKYRVENPNLLSKVMCTKHDWSQLKRGSLFALLWQSQCPTQSSQIHLCPLGLFFYKCIIQVQIHDLNTQHLIAYIRGQEVQRLHDISDPRRNVITLPLFFRGEKMKRRKIYKDEYTWWWWCVKGNYIPHRWNHTICHLSCLMLSRGGLNQPWLPLCYRIHSSHTYGTASGTAPSPSYHSHCRVCPGAYQK